MALPRPHVPAHTFDKGPPPDLSARFKLKHKYAQLQRQYNHALQMRKDLTIEVAEKEAKVQRLQDEVDLILDQVYSIDYAHLLPEDDDLFSEAGDYQEPISSTSNSPSSASTSSPSAPHTNGHNHAHDNGHVNGKGKEKAEESNGPGLNGHSEGRDGQGAGDFGEASKRSRSESSSAPGARGEEGKRVDGGGDVEGADRERESKRPRLEATDSNSAPSELQLCDASETQHQHPPSTVSNPSVDPSSTTPASVEEPRRPSGSVSALLNDSGVTPPTTSNGAGSVGNEDGPLFVNA